MNTFEQNMKRITNREVKLNYAKMQEQVQFLLRQNNELGRINVSALQTMERIENIVLELQGTVGMMLLGLVFKRVRQRIFRDLAIIHGQTSRFTIKDKAGNFLIKATKSPDEEVAKKTEEAKQQEQEGADTAKGNND